MKTSIHRIAPLLLVANYGVSSLGYAEAAPVDAQASTETMETSTKLPWMGPSGFAYILNAVKPPPASRSPAEKVDLNALLKAQSSRTEADIQEAMANQHFNLGLLTRVVGPDCTAEKYPVTFALLDKVLREEKFFIAGFKKKYQRPRPYVGHPELKNLYSAKTTSYPDETAAVSRSMSLLLMELFPAKTSDLLNRDLAIGQSEINAGVSYPTDIYAGRNLAHAIAYVTHDTPQFQSELNKAKVETGVLMLPPTK
jgi:acid phosphatase (class A)